MKKKLISITIDSVLKETLQETGNLRQTSLSKVVSSTIYDYRQVLIDNVILSLKYKDLAQLKKSLLEVKNIELLFSIKNNRGIVENALKYIEEMSELYWKEQLSFVKNTLNKKDEKC